MSRVYKQAYRNIHTHRQSLYTAAMAGTTVGDVYVGKHQTNPVGLAVCQNVQHE